MNFVFFFSVLIVSAAAGYFIWRIVSLYRVRSAKQRAEEIIQEAENSIDEIRNELREEIGSVESYREEFEEQIETLQSQIEKQEERLESLRERYNNRQSIANKIKDNIETLEQSVEKTRQELDDLRSEQIRELEEKSNTKRKDLLSKLENQTLSRIRLVCKRMNKSTTESFESRQEDIAGRILDRAIQRCDITTPLTVPSAVLKFPDDEAYEQFHEFYKEHKEPLIEDLESDIRFEEDQFMAVVETLEPLRKEIVHRTLNNIIQQKKFNYELVEDGLEKYTRQVESEQQRAAREALNEANVSNVPQNLVDKLGILKFRTSYGQQQLVHSREVAHLGELMAYEIGADPETTKRAGMLHDIGKAIDRQRDQGHAVVGAELAEEAGESNAIVNAIGSHHGDMEPKYLESILVAAADAISGSRPGVRRENVTNYSERIESLRELASNRQGIKKVYAMNAGRELRIRVNKELITDSEMEKLARSIAEDIENELTYSGQIKINTIRETRITQTAHTE